MWEKEYQNLKLKKLLEKLPKKSLEKKVEVSSEPKADSEDRPVDKPRNVLKITEADRGRSKRSKIFIVTNRSVRGHYD